MGNLITARQLRPRIGGVSDMTIWRWLNDPSLNFPKPIKIQSRRYWCETEVSAWLEQRAGD